MTRAVEMLKMLRMTLVRMNKIITDEFDPFAKYLDVDIHLERTKGQNGV
jgi:hypothetical protein